MKRGDLVKHPKGIENVCKKTYAIGIVLDAFRPGLGFGGGKKQIKVQWHNKQSHLVYYEDQLEVISENR